MRHTVQNVTQKPVSRTRQEAPNRTADCCYILGNSRGVGTVGQEGVPSASPQEGKYIACFWRGAQAKLSHM